MRIGGDEANWIERSVDQSFDFASAIIQAKKEVELEIGKPLKGLPLTFGMELLMHSIGAAEFNQEILKLLDIPISSRAL